MSTDIRLKVMVTGANGHLGRRLIERLAPECSITAVVRSERAKEQLTALDLPDLQVHLLDYADMAALSGVAKGCSVAIHLVGIIKESAASSYQQAHEHTSAALAKAAATCELDKIIYLSILGAEPSARNSCLASKGRAAQLLLAGPTPALVIRVPMVLGEDDFASAALRSNANGRIAFSFRARSLEQPIYAGDVIDAIVAGLERDGPCGEIDLAGPESLSRKALLERAGRTLGKEVRVVSLPLLAGFFVASILERLMKSPPVTRAMLGVLDHDDELDPGPGCELLGIKLTSLDDTLARCLNGAEE